MGFRDWSLVNTVFAKSAADAFVQISECLRSDIERHVMMILLVRCCNALHLRLRRDSVVVREIHRCRAEFRLRLLNRLVDCRSVYAVACHVLLKVALLKKRAAVERRGTRLAGTLARLSSGCKILILFFCFGFTLHSDSVSDRGSRWLGLVNDVAQLVVLQIVFASRGTQPVLNLVADELVILALTKET